MLTQNSKAGSADVPFFGMSATRIPSGAYTPTKGVWTDAPPASPGPHWLKGA